MASAPPNPTQLTPPRVAVIDERTGAISREWYRFFLSLLTSTQATSDAADTQPDTSSLLTTLQQQIDEVYNETSITPPSLSGTVTSVDASGGLTGFVFTGGPITTSGTLTLSGTLNVANGGTGQTSYTNGQLLIGNTTGSTLTKATLTAGTAISIVNGPGSISITNTAPDQIVSLTGAGTTVVTGTYPSFTITSNDAFVGTVTSVNLTAGTGISVSGGPITTSGSITVVNTAPDQIVSLTGAGTTSITGTYPSFTITSNDAFVGTVTSVSGTGSVNGITLTGTVTSSGSLTLGGTLSGVSLTSQVTGTLPVTNGGTGTATAFTAGSVVFAGTSGVYSQDNTNLFWNDSLNRLGIGTSSPSYTLDILSGDTTPTLGYAVRIRGNATAGAGAIQFTDSAVTAQWGFIAASATEVTVQADGSSVIKFNTGGLTKFQVGASGQFGIGGATYGSVGQVLTSGGASAAPTWSTPTTGTVTSVSGTGSVNGITLTGTVTSSGSLTLGGTLSVPTSQITGLATVATSGSFADLSNKPGIRSNGQNVVGGSITLGSGDKGTNILIVTSGITITFPSSGYASGEGVAISNVSGGNVTLSAPGGADFGATLPNNGTLFVFCDGGGFWRQYCYSTSRL